MRDLGDTLRRYAVAKKASLTAKLQASVQAYIARALATDPNPALAQTAKRAIQMPEESRREAEIARRTSSAIRLLALVAGVCAPLVMAYLIYRVTERAEPRPEDLLEVVQTEGLAERSALRLKHLTTAQPPLLAQQRNDRRPRQGN